MRSAPSEHKVGLLLFDEPSASLDPTAEHGKLFRPVPSALPRRSDTPPRICRPFRAATAATGHQDDGILFTPFRQPDQACRPYTVSPAAAAAATDTDTSRAHSYMHNTAVVEAGTHDELLKREGEYARLWRLQAQAFM